MAITFGEDGKELSMADKLKLMSETAEKQKAEKQEEESTKSFRELFKEDKPKLKTEFTPREYTPKPFTPEQEEAYLESGTIPRLKKQRLPKEFKFTPEQREYHRVYYQRLKLEDPIRHQQYVQKQKEYVEANKEIVMQKQREAQRRLYAESPEYREKIKKRNFAREQKKRELKQLAKSAELGVIREDKLS